MKNLGLNPPERIIRYKWVIRIVVVIVCLAFWNMVDYNIRALKAAAARSEEDVSVLNYEEVIFQKVLPEVGD